MAATKAMIDYAKAIAEKLGCDEPDFSSFNETSNFIGENSARYKSIRVVANLQNLYGGMDRKLTANFKAALEDIYGLKGIYVFWNEDKIVYIGKSVNLQERVYSSLKERCRESAITHLTLLFTLHEADMHIFEVVLITEYKPLLNKDCICEGYSKYFKSNIDLYSLDKIKVFERDEDKDER